METASRLEPRLLQSEENPITPDKVKSVVADGVAGIIMTSIPSKAVETALSKVAIPVVLIGVRSQTIESRHDNVSIILNDNAGIGTMAAEYLLHHGQFRTFGFVSAGDNLDWSLEREHAFIQTLTRHGKQTTTFHTTFPVEGEDDHAALAKWLTALPKPAALMAACDWRCEQVLDICKELSIKVPDRISLIGVDNDEFICAHTTPQLSSVLPSHDEMGRRAAAVLDRMTAGKPFNSIAMIPPKRVVERESSTFIPPSMLLVDCARRYIAANACHEITVADIVSHLKVSRRLAELRFREIEGKTMREAIESRRLARLTALLSSTSRPLAVVARECGYTNMNTIGHLFKKRFGMSMRDYRNQHLKADFADPAKP